VARQSAAEALRTAPAAMIVGNIGFTIRFMFSTPCFSQTASFRNLQNEELHSNWYSFIQRQHD
jgi:hypothetical protein